MIMPPDLIIFDCDGVLVDSEPATNAELAADLTERGLPLTGEEAQSLFVGQTMASVMVEAARRGAEMPENWLDLFYPRMFARLEAGLPPIPHLDVALAAIDAAGIPTCVASNGPSPKMSITLRGAGLWERFEGRIFSAHDVGIAKPDPGLFLHAARACGVAPERSVVIEDSASGVRAAVAAGMPCYGYVAETPAELLTAHGAIPFDSFTKLPDLLAI